MKKLNEYATCSGCQKLMKPQQGCTISHIMIGNKKYERIKAGDKLDFDPDMKDGNLCRDCNVGIGEYHHCGCDAERCPLCQHQLIGCDCDIEADALNHYYTEDAEKDTRSTYGKSKN